MVFGTICNIVYLIQDSTLEACVGKYMVYWVGSVRNGNIQSNVGNHFQNVIREKHLKISKKTIKYDAVSPTKENENFQI